MKKNILFISNDLGRTGAPLILLKIAEHFKANGFNCSFFLEGGGELYQDYKAIGPVYLYNLNFNRYRSKMVRFPLKFAWLVGKMAWRYYLKSKMRYRKNEYVYCNTGISGYLLSFLKPETENIFMHVHEMEFILKYYCKSKFTEGIPLVKRFITVCDESKQTLAQDYHIPASKVNVIPEFGFFENLKALPFKENQAQFTVGLSGFPNWRKGTDLLFQVAKGIQARPEGAGIRFVWVGYNEEDAENTSFNFDQKKAGLSDRIEFIKPTKDVLPLYAKFDIFLLLSREDPNPLVVLECGAMGIPVVCFEGSGRTTDLVSKGGGMQVPYLDINGMINAIIEMRNNHDLRRSCSENIAKEVDENYNAKKILNELRQEVMEHSN